MISVQFSVVTHGQLQSLNSSSVGSFTRFLFTLDKLLDSLTCDQCDGTGGFTADDELIGLLKDISLTAGQITGSTPGFSLV